MSSAFSRLFCFFFPLAPLVLWWLDVFRLKVEPPPDLAKIIAEAKRTTGPQ